MASGRMIRSQISLSPQVNDLCLKGALLFTWLIPHVDDYGRVNADPRRIKAKIVPMRDDIPSSEILLLLKEMESKNLIVLYTIEDEIYLQLTKFEKHQSGLHKRTESKIPPPEAALNLDSWKFREIPGNSYPTRTGTRTGTELEQEENLKTNTSPSAPDLVQEIFEHWQKTMGKEKSSLDKNRISKIKNAMNLGYTVGQLKDAIVGCSLSEWNMGKNPSNKKYNSLDLIFRNSDKIESYLEVYERSHGGVVETYCDPATLFGGY